MPLAPGPLAPRPPAGVSAEVYVCQRMCKETGGEYAVALSEAHLQELMLALAPPPPAIASHAASELVGRRRACCRS